MKNPVPIIRFDPHAPRDYSPLTIGSHTVRRSRLAGTHHTIYTIMHGDQIAGRQISYPDLSDCDRAVKNCVAASMPQRIQSAMLDTQLHESIVRILQSREMDARDLCLHFSKTRTALTPVLAMLITEQRITRRGTTRRPIYTAPAVSAQIPTAMEQ